MKRNSKKVIGKTAAMILNIVTVGVGNQSANAVTNIAAVTTGTLTPTNNALAGTFTTTSLTTAADAVATITLTNSTIVAGNVVRASVAAYSGTGGIPVLTTKSVANGSCVLYLGNAGGAAFDGVFTIFFEVLQSQPA